MKGKQLLYLMTLITLSVTIETKRKLTNPASRQLRILNPDSDDSELMQLEASGSNKKHKDKAEHDKVKTLSQQVAEGKYGLIQKELFSKPPKRPGILSYELNSEVPNDTINNLGGLDKNEIWLAENHLLVLKGGSFPPYDEKKEHPESIWPPLDTFKAPLHQVKIPLKPKVPPPFPVQLTEGGPLQILGTNFSRTVNETDKSAPYPIQSPEKFAPGQKNPPGYPDSPNAPPGSAALPIPVVNQGEYSPGVSFPPPNLNESWPPFLGYLPPGAVILPPPGNQTDLYDDEDPSIYYPPPYSFYYPTDNSSAVPPGPLVPGIILAPPPNFFAWLDETTTTPLVTLKSTPVQRQRKPTSSKPNTQIYPTTTLLPATMKAKGVLPEKPFKVYPIKEVITYEKKPSVITTERPKIVTLFPPHNRTYLPAKTNKPHFVRKNPQNTTVLRPVKQKTPTALKNPYIQNEIIQNPLETLRGKNPNVSTTQIPPPYTTHRDIGAYSVNKFNSKHKPNKVSETTVKPSQYYYYDETESKVTTPKIPIRSNNYYGATEGFYIPPKPSHPSRPKKPQYVYVTARPYNTQKPRFRFIQQPVHTDSFSIHIAKLQNQIRHYYTTTRTPKRPSPKPVYQYSFQAANYHSQNDYNRPQVAQNEYHRPQIPQNEYTDVPAEQPPKYSVQIQQAIEIFPTETPKYHNVQQVVYHNKYQQSTERPYLTSSKPDYQYEDVTQAAPYYQQVTTARPILQYSFEVTQNPLYQGFYTKPDEGYFDENTREYFTVFGKKLPIQTTPIPQFAVTETYTSQSEQKSIYQQGSRYQQKPILLGSDTVVNYVNPVPNVDPQAETIPVRNPKLGRNYPNVVKYSAKPKQIKEQQPEIIKAIEVPVASKENQDGSYISYELPGDEGAHFYFLTPQLAQRREQGARFYYSKPNSKRIRRDEIISDKDR